MSFHRRHPRNNPTRLMPLLLGTLLLSMVVESAAHGDLEAVKPRTEGQGRASQGRASQERASQHSPAPPATTAEELLAAGRQRMRAGQESAAEGLFQRALALDPTSPAARDLGLLRGRQGRLEQAYPPLRSWAQSHPNDTEANLAAAACAVELRRAEEAAQLLERMPPKQPLPRLLHARLALLQGDPERTVELLDLTVIEQAPPAVALDMRRIAAQANLILGHASTTVELLDGHQGHDPNLVLQLARALYQEGSAQRSSEVLRPLVEALTAGKVSLSNELSGDLQFSYGRALLAQRKPAEAVVHLRQAVESDPSDREAWQLLGRALVLAGQRQEGMAALRRFQHLSQAEDSDLKRRARQTEEATDPTKRNIARALELERTGDSEQALAVLRNEAELVPADPRPGLFAGRLLLRLKRYDEAAEAARDLLARFPNRADVWLFEGSVLRTQGMMVKAQASLEQALKLDPGYAAAMVELADLLTSQDRDEEARAWLARARELDSKDQQHQQHQQSTDLSSPPER